MGTQGKIVAYYVSTPEGRQDFDTMREARRAFQNPKARVLGRWRETVRDSERLGRSVRSRSGEVVEDRR